jgi:putative hydrolase of the HAD superfamily
MSIHPLPNPERIRAITFDLDDTLWPNGPTIERAEGVLADWLREHAPGTAARFGLEATRALREEVARLFPERAHDLSAMRRETIRRMLAASGDDESLAEPAFQAFFAARQRVAFFDDALPALRRLAARWPLLAVSNGNADLQRIGLSDWFVGAVNAQQVGIGKPDARIYHAAAGRLGLEPGVLLHVGDHPRLDAQAALDAGLHAAWVVRGDPVDPATAPRCWRGPDLLALADALGV